MLNRTGSQRLHRSKVLLTLHLLRRHRLHLIRSSGCGTDLPRGWLSAIPRLRALCATQSARAKRGPRATDGGAASAPPDPVENVEQYMSDENKMLVVLVVVLVFAMVTYVAFINPPLGIALSVGVAVAMLVWVVLRNK